MAGQYDYTRALGDLRAIKAKQDGGDTLLYLGFHPLEGTGIDRESL